MDTRTSRFSRRPLLALLALAAPGCAVEMYFKGVKVGTNLTGSSGPAPTLASVTLLAGNTGSRQVVLEYGAITGTYSQYCILENNTSASACSWTNGLLPSQYSVSDVTGSKTLSVWIRNDAGSSARVDSSAFTYDATVAISPVSVSPTATRGSLMVESVRYRAGVTNLSNGNIIAVGGAWDTGASMTPVRNAILYRNTAYGTVHLWEGTAPLWVGRIAPAVVELPDGKILAIGGCTNNTDSGTATVEVYDPTTRRWSLRTSMASARCNLTATRLSDGRVLVAGGQDGATTHATTEIYRSDADLWSAGPALSGPRRAHSAVLLTDGRVAIVGGHDGAAVTGAFDLYDPTSNTFSAQAAMTTARQDFGLVLFPASETSAAGDSLLALGGFDGTNFLPTVEAYDLTGNAWTAKPSMAQNRRYNVYAKLGSGRLLAAGGITSAANALTTSTQRYDWATSSWSARSALPRNVGMHAVGVLGDGTVVSIGGIHTTTNRGSPFTYEYNDTLNNWASGFHLGRNAMNVGSSLLADGRVLICGGFDGGTSALSADCLTYDPATNAFSAAMRLRTAKEGARSALLTNGITAIVGGCYQTAVGCDTGSAELDLFDPATGVRTAGTDLPGGAGLHNQVLVPLSGNRLLVAGGVIGQITSTPVNTAYIYSYDTNSWAATTNPMPAERARMVGVKLPVSGRIFVHGGFSYPGSVETFHNTLWEYIDATQSWVVHPSATVSRGWHAATAFSEGGVEKLMVNGGDQNYSSVIHNSAEIFNAGTNTWEAGVGAMAGTKTLHRVHHASGSNQIWAFGGWGSSQNRVYEYSISARTWSLATNLSNSHFNVFTSSVALNDGRYFIFHGGNNGTYVRVAEVYHFAQVVDFTGTAGGDRIFSFAKLFGSGTLHDLARIFVSPYPLTGGPARVEVLDGNGHSAQSDITY